MPENNLIKSISEHECPSCGGLIYVETETLPTIVSSVFEPDDVAVAKSEVIRLLDGIDIDADKKADVIKWVNDPETIFNQSEARKIIDSLQEPTV